MTLSIAFYGAGARAQVYLQALAGRPDVGLTAVCDLDRRAAEQTAAGWGADVYLSYEAMLEEARPNLLWICIAPHLQGDVILKATELRIPFFVATPGAMDFQHARAYGGLIAKANLVTTVGFSGRYTDVVKEAREYLGANPVPLALGWWLCRAEGDVGDDASRLLWSDTCRFIDALRLFCGDVDHVRALPAGKDTKHGGLVLQMEFDTGTVGVLSCATFARAEPRIELEFMGEGWAISFDEDVRTLRLAERDKTTILRCLNNPAADHVGAFLAAAEAQKPEAVAPDYGDALCTLAVCQAAIISARESRTVSLSELAGEAPNPEPTI